MFSLSERRCALRGPLPREQKAAPVVKVDDIRVLAEEPKQAERRLLTDHRAARRRDLAGEGKHSRARLVSRVDRKKRLRPRRQASNRLAQRRTNTFCTSAPRDSENSFPPTAKGLKM